ncbi:hypothetical protein COO60DRAFT_1547317 [Scenedesmus sp. NREL 46B-D3]|nr:hypothetical protein COO60DRAFT_1547317 [Scenedesmus sp. NREL 46B-D3]
MGNMMMMTVHQQGVRFARWERAQHCVHAKVCLIAYHPPACCGTTTCSACSFVLASIVPSECAAPAALFSMSSWFADAHFGALFSVGLVARASCFIGAASIVDVTCVLVPLAVGLTTSRLWRSTQRCWHQFPRHVLALPPVYLMQYIRACLLLSKTSSTYAVSKIQAHLSVFVVMDTIYADTRQQWVTEHSDMTQHCMHTTVHLKALSPWCGSQLRSMHPRLDPGHKLNKVSACCVLDLFLTSHVSDR